MSETQSQKDPMLLKNTALLVGWIAGLVLVAGIVWFLTQPVRNHFLLKAVNQVLEQSGNPFRLGLPVSPAALNAGVSKMGSWYTMGLPGQAGDIDRIQQDGTRAFIFTFIGEGIFFPCAAVVAPGGTVVEFIPLSSHGEKMLKRVSPEILKLYARRIEGYES